VSRAESISAPLVAVALVGLTAGQAPPGPDAAVTVQARRQAEGQHLAEQEAQGPLTEPATAPASTGGFFGFDDTPTALPFGEEDGVTIGGRFYEEGAPI